MTTVAEADEDLRLFTLKQVAGLWGISLSYLQKAVAARAIEYTNFDPLKSGKGRALMSREQIRKVMADSVSKPLTGPRR